MFGDQQTDSVDTVTDTTEGKRETNTNTVNDSSSEETHDSEGTVERGVLDAEKDALVK